MAAENASFQLSFTKVGLVPDAGSTWLLPRAVGRARAAEMALLGRAVGAAEALRWGLVNEVTPQATYASGPCIRRTRLPRCRPRWAPPRQLLNHGLSTDLAEKLEVEATAQGRTQQGPDYEEARMAFAEKRRPRFARP